MISGGGRVIDFDAMDRAVRVCAGTSAPCPAGPATTDFAYAPDGSRYRQRIWGAVDAKYGPKTVYYVDKDYELVVWGNLQTEERTYVGGSVVLYRANGGARQERYQHLDRLGSVDAVTDANAQKVTLDLHGYDAFGKPRAEAWTPSQDRLHPNGDLGATTDRGFTGHEHLDLHYLVHMNGRVYDYRLGRFLSVDPFVADPLDSQSINPYSYIGNNPLSGVDPTGYCPQGAKPGGNNNACGGSARGGWTAPSFAEARAQGSIGGRAGTNVTFNGFDQGTAAGQAIFQASSGATPQRTEQSTRSAPDAGGPKEAAKSRVGESSEPKAAGTKWLGDGSALDRDTKDLLEGRITQQVFRDRYTARGVAAWTGLVANVAALAGILGLGSAAESTGVIGVTQQVAARLATAEAAAGGGAIAAGGAKSAYEIALAGGKHAGTLRNYAGRSAAEIQKGITSLERQVALHQQKIANPAQFAGRWGQMSAQEQAGLLNKWGADAARNQELADVLRGLLGSR